MKILIVVNNLRVANGVATVIMNQYNGLISEKNEVEFLQFMSFDSKYLKEIEQKNGKIYTVEKNLKSFRKLFKIINDGNYDIVHINQMNLQTVFLSIYAKFKKVKCIIYHSHNTKIPGGFKRKILQKASNLVYNNCSTHFIACSEKAGRDAFKNKKFVILKNSINVKKFEYDYKIRNTYRERNNINSNTFVVGTVCRYSNQKNPIFMIDIFSEIVKKIPNSIFLWIGSAPSEDDPIIEQMNKRVEELGLKNNIMWLGSKEDVYNWYSVMDVFLMPSKWEGLGITYIESQANSLPTFASDVVPIDTNVTSFMNYLSLEESATKWAEKICEYPVRNEKSKVDNYKKFVEQGYDVNSSGKSLLEIYKKFMKE